MRICSFLPSTTEIVYELGLGDKLAAHVVLAASAIGLGILVALPLAVWASRSPAVSRIALGLAGDLATTALLAVPPGVPRLLCPAMNPNMPAFPNRAPVTNQPPRTSA